MLYDKKKERISDISDMAMFRAQGEKYKGFQRKGHVYV
jgi:hypothetical protein